MNSFLKKIITESKDRCPSVKEVSSFNLTHCELSFFEALTRKESSPALIGEIKKASPSEGPILPDANLQEYIRMYKRKASAISILTEPAYFMGSLSDLSRATQEDIPCLRKDFLVDPSQVLEARHYGASAYLLIVAALSDQQLVEMIDAGKEYNMPALVEVHDEKELERALQTSAEIIGINNRNLHTLEIDLKTSIDLSHQAKNSGFSGKLIAESGLASKDDILKLPDFIDAVLIGTSIMKSKDPAAKLDELFPEN